MLYRAVLFDLDGTLLDTLKDTGDAINNALTSLSCPPHPINDYKRFVGDGAMMLAYRVLPETHRNDETANQLLKLFDEEYSRHFRVHTRPFDGIPELLDALTAKGIKMAILTNRSQHYASILVSELLAAWSFDVITGSRQSIPLKPDPTAALQTAVKMNISPGEFILLGDSGVDMKTATAAGMHPVGALWGNRTADELTTAGAALLVQHPDAVLQLLAE